MPGDRKNRRSWIQASSMGVEFAAAIAGFTLLGYWVDRHYGCGPKGVLIGAGLGIVGGGYNLIRESMQAIRDAQSKDQDDDASKP